jgi:TPP-dependent pyruvate/acetoin dehydrogenase alpha subunit
MAAKRFENPLLSDKRLREMYTVMVETRALCAGMRRGKVRGFGLGLEACWVGSGIGLRDGDAEGDFVSAGGIGSVLDVVLGVGMKAAMREERSEKRLDAGGLKGMARVCFALGAASWRVGAKTVGLIYVGTGELSAAEWKLALGEALRRELPLVFVAIPEKGIEADVAEAANKWGVPGIPVDASDAVAMYRVAQESIGRARAGGGAALIEGVMYPKPSDPVALLRRHLVAKKVATERWCAGVEEKVRRGSAGWAER